MGNIEVVQDGEENEEVDDDEDVDDDEPMMTNGKVVLVGCSCSQGVGLSCTVICHVIRMQVVTNWTVFKLLHDHDHMSPYNQIIEELVAINNHSW